MKPTLYRMRLIPAECIPLSDDRILYAGEDRLVTAWTAIHKRPDLAFGYSCYYLDRGFKISRFYGHDGAFLYWYCDIIRTIPMPQENAFCFKDLLADVKISPQGELRVLDLDELAQAMTSGLLEPEEPAMCLRQLDDLLKVWYRGEFDGLTALLIEKESEDRARKDGENASTCV